MLKVQQELLKVAEIELKEGQIEKEQSESILKKYRETLAACCNEFDSKQSLTRHQQAKEMVSAWKLRFQMLCCLAILCVLFFLLAR
jgi:hypothetical protein